jgi:hypothetical protein
MSPKSHDEIIRDLNRMLEGNTKPRQSRRQRIARIFAHEAGKALAVVAVMLVMAFLGLVFLNTLHAIGVIGFTVTYTQAVCLFLPPLFFILAVPFTINVRMKK